MCIRDSFHRAADHEVSFANWSSTCIGFSGWLHPKNYL
jgi:hypothetical protein